MGSLLAEAVEEAAQPEDLFMLQGGIVVDVEAVEVDVVGVGELLPRLGLDDALQVGLAHLVAAARGAAAELDAFLAQGVHHAAGEAWALVLEDEREGVVAAALGVEVGLIEVGIKVVEEGVQV